MESSRALVSVLLVSTVGVLPAFLAGAVAVQIRAELEIGEAIFGLAVAVFFATAAVGSGRMGRLSERLGPWRALRVAAIVSGAVLATIGFAAHAWWILLACLAMGGLANGLAQPAANLALARAIPAHRLGLAFGVKQSAIPAATLLSGLAVPSLAMKAGFRAAFLAGAALAVVAAISVARSHAKRTPSRGTSAMEPRNDAHASTLAWMGAGAGLGACAAGALGAFLVSSAVRAGLSNAWAGYLLTGGSIAGLVTRLGTGALVDRRPDDPLRLVVGMLAVGTLGYGLLSVPTDWAHAVAAPIAFAFGWGWPALFNFAVVRSSPRSPGAATGATQTGTYIGAGAGPFLFGLLADGQSYAVAWTTMAGFALLAAVAFFIARQRLVREGGTVSP